MSTAHLDKVNKEIQAGQDVESWIRGIRRAKETVEKDRRDGTMFGQQVPQERASWKESQSATLALTRGTLQREDANRHHKVHPRTANDIIDAGSATVFHQLQDREAKLQRFLGDVSVSVSREEDKTEKRNCMTAAHHLFHDTTGTTQQTDHTSAIRSDQTRPDRSAEVIIITNVLMLVQQNNFTHLRVLLVLTDRGILAQSN
jgi:hypothetical protein